MASQFAFTYAQKKEMAGLTAKIMTDEIGLKGDAVQAVLLGPDLDEGKITLEEIRQQYGESVARILEGLDLRWRARISVTCSCRSLRTCGWC